MKAETKASPSTRSREGGESLHSRERVSPTSQTSQTACAREADSFPALTLGLRRTSARSRRSPRQPNRSVEELPLRSCTQRRGSSEGRAGGAKAAFALQSYPRRHPSRATRRRLEWAQDQLSTSLTTMPWVGNARELCERQHGRNAAAALTQELRIKRRPQSTPKPR